MSRKTIAALELEIMTLKGENVALKAENDNLKAHQAACTPELSEREKRHGVMRATFWYGGPTKTQIKKGLDGTENIAVALDWEGKIVDTGMVGFVEKGRFKPSMNTIRDPETNAVRGWMRYFGMDPEVTKKVIAKAAELKKLGELKREYPRKFHGFSPKTEREEERAFNPVEGVFNNEPGGIL